MPAVEPMNTFPLESSANALTESDESPSLFVYLIRSFPSITTTPLSFVATHILPRLSSNINLALVRPSLTGSFSKFMPSYLTTPLYPPIQIYPSRVAKIQFASEVGSPFDASYKTGRKYAPLICSVAA